MGSSKILFVMLVALTLHASATLALPVIHVINSVEPNSPPIIFMYKVSNFASTSQIQLRPRQDYQIEIQKNVVYSLTATLGVKFASVYIYDPARDSGKPAVFWRGDAFGWSISYDNAQYKQVKAWESE